MKVLIAIFFLLACTMAQAAHLDYPTCRKWVEQQCLTNTTPQDERLFVGRMVSPRHASIVRFHKGVTLREIIDGTPLKGKTVLVCVMRPDRTETMPFTRYAYVRVGPSETPNYELRPLDVIWLYDNGPIIET